MKRVLSVVLALVMVAATFTMLVTNAVAATMKDIAETEVLYTADFEGLDGKTPEEILAATKMKDENSVTGVLGEMYVANGSLRFAKPAQQDTFFVLKDKDVLKDGFVIEYDLEFLGSSALDNGFTFITGEGRGYNSNLGRDGLISQMRFNTNVLSSVNDAGWKTIKNATPTSLANYQDNNGDGKKDMLNQRTSVKAVFDPNGYVVKTFAQPYKAELDAWDEATMASVSTTTATDYSALYGNDLRLMIYSGASAAMDNLKITTLDGQEIYSEDFNDIQATTNFGILDEIGWESHQNDDSEAYIRCENGRLIVGQSTGLAVSAQQELILLENNEKVKNGFVVEYDFEIPYGTKGDHGFGFHSAMTTGSGSNAARYGWVSQFRWNRQVLNGACNGSSWLEHNCNATYMAHLTANASNMQGTHLAVRAVFDPVAGCVTTYAKKYTGTTLTWTENDVIQKSKDLSEYTDMLDGTVRLVVYDKIALRIDNIKITTLDNVTAAKARVLYEANFNNLNGKTPAEILAGANMRDENTEAGSIQYLSVQDGRLNYGKTGRNGEAFVVIKDEDALTNGYTIEYDLTIIGGDNTDDAFSFHSMDTDKYNIREGRIGWVSQIRRNKAVLCGVEKGRFKDWNKDGTLDSKDEGWLQTNGNSLDSFKNYSNLDGVTVAVKAVFDAQSKTVTTYMQDISTAAKVEWSDAHKVTTSPSLAGYEELLSDDLRLIIYNGVCAEMDNLTVTLAEGVFADGNTTKTWTFDDVQAATVQDMVTEFGWTSSQNPDLTNTVMTVEDGKIRFGNSESFTTSKQEELVLLDNLAAKDGFVVEYDAVITKWGNANRGDGFGFHSALATGTSTNPSRFGWVSQIRGNTNVLCGAQTGANSWQQINNGTTANMKAAVNNAGNMDGIHIAVRAVFDPVNKVVKTYVQRYTNATLIWTENHLVQTSKDLTAYTNDQYNTQYVRLVIYGDFEMSIDNIKITALEKTPNVYGYQADSTNSQNIRLLGVIDNEIFTTADKVGFRVTMTKVADPTATATKDIDCNWVYRSVTEWGKDTPTTADEMLYGASYVYALHVKGITEAVNITVVPYYVESGTDRVCFGDATSFLYDPANPPA